MFLLILIWSVDAVAVSTAMESVNQVFFLWSRYLFALPVVGAIVRHREGLHLPRRADVPLLLLSMLLGDILYFVLEYTAFKYLPVSLVTVLLGFLPAASYLTDKALTHTAPRLRTLVMILLSIGGLSLVVLEDQSFQSGGLIGYVCCLLCLVIWIAYGYVTRKLYRDYSVSAITFYEMIAAFAVMLPIAVHYRPSVLPARDFLFSIVVMGILSSGFGFLIEVKGLIDLGTTVCGVYENLLPVFTAVTGFLFLHERMTGLQIAGAAVVILCGFLIDRQTEMEDAAEEMQKNEIKRG